MSKLGVYFLGLFLFICSIQTNAQVTIQQNDTTICPGASITLNAIRNGRIPTNLSLTDDLYTSVINIGFPFTFYGNTYSQCVFSSNGYICFNTANAGLFSPWSITGGIPGNTALLNSIAAFYSDIFPTSGSLDYATVGTAPNRKFIVSFCDIPMFSCTTLKTSFQIILFETTNEIEIHIANAPLCTTWNGGLAIEGLQNATGTIAHPITGRNAQQWTAFRSSHRFTPTSATNYTITPIAYYLIPDAYMNLNWVQTGTTTSLGTSPSITVSPASNTCYTVMGTSCQDTTRDTVCISMGGLPVVSSFFGVNPTVCGGNGIVQLNGLTPNTNYVVKYVKNAVLVTVNVSSDNTGAIKMYLPAGTYSNIVVYQGLCFTPPIGPITITNPPFIADFNYAIKYGCDEDTVTLVNNSTQSGFMSYSWDFGNGTGDTAKNTTVIYPIKAVQNVTLISSNGVCKDTVVKQIDTRHSLDASFTVSEDSICGNTPITFTSTSTFNSPSGSAAPSYLWDFGDGAFDNNPTATHTYAAPGVYTATLYVNDFVPCIDSAKHEIHVYPAPSLNFYTDKDSLCEGNGITFYAVYDTLGIRQLMWDFGDNSKIYNRDSILHAYDSSGTFTVKLTASYRICPDSTYEKSVTLKPYPMVDLGPDTLMCPNSNPIVLFDRIPKANTVSWWTTGDTASSIVVYHPGIYGITANMDGCITSDSVEVKKDCYIEMPNTFTPNGDDLNDYFFPKSLLSRGVTAFKMSIFNRWGQLIFETTNPEGRGWDGRWNGVMQPNGVYIYLLDATLKNGKTEHYQGNVTLLR
ncbi:MAG: hypothetical protein RIQ61_1699 [Bacteroidota bacterium]|jgi:gliding motility-associated-like protein